MNHKRKFHHRKFCIFSVFQKPNLSQNLLLLVRDFTSTLGSWGPCKGMHYFYFYDFTGAVNGWDVYISLFFLYNYFAVIIIIGWQTSTIRSGSRLNCHIPRQLLAVCFDLYLYSRLKNPYLVCMDYLYILSICPNWFSNICIWIDLGNVYFHVW